MDKFLPADVIKKQNGPNGQQAENLQKQQVCTGTHRKKHEHKNSAANQHIVVDGANNLKIRNLLLVLQFKWLRNVKTIRHHNAGRVGWHQNANRLVFAQVVNVHSIDDKAKL